MGVYCKLKFFNSFLDTGVILIALKKKKLKLAVAVMENVYQITVLLQYAYAVIQSRVYFNY